VPSKSGNGTTWVTRLLDVAGRLFRALPVQSGKVRVHLERLRESFWFVPAILCTAAFLLGIGMPYLDSRGVKLPEDMTLLVYDIGPAGARSVLTATAGSSIGIAATVFSITIATLTLTSSQFGPRLLRTFTADRGVQFALGWFLANFTYPLLVLRTVRVGAGEGSPPFVPYIAVTLGLLLAIATVGVLIYFIDHVSRIIRAPQVIESVGAELDQALDLAVPPDASKGDRMTPPAKSVDGENLPGEVPELRPTDATCITRSNRAGYVGNIDFDPLIDIASETQTTLWLDVAIGDYIFPNQPLLSVAKQDRHRLSDKNLAKVWDAFALTGRRTKAADPVFIINQLSEIAQRALSPGINDPFTAMNCCDRLAASLARIGPRTIPDPRFRDEQGTVRVVSIGFDWPELVGSAFDGIIRHGSDDAAVLQTLLDVLEKLLHATPDLRRRAQIAVRARAAVEAIRGESGLPAGDHRSVERAYARFCDAVNAG
jgi:uncharacterized membrane protein